MTKTRAGGVTNFDAWKHAYAARAENLAVSEVRALFSVVSLIQVEARVVKFDGRSDHIDCSSFAIRVVK